MRKILPAASFLLAFACLQAPVALAQHGGGGHGGGFGGGHSGGGSGHFGGGGFHMGAPHGSASAHSHGGVTGFRGSAVAFPPARFNAGSFRFRGNPIHHPHPQPFPIFGFPIFFNAPFFFGGAFNSFWWPPCGPFWGPGCSFSPFYGYGYGGLGYGGYDYGLDFGNSFPTYGVGGGTTEPGYSYPQYPYSRGARDLAELFFKDGTVYDVTDYWLIGGQIYFTTVDERGEKAVEHVRDLDQLDMQTTVDVNTQRGFKFQLRNAPIEQYLREHPEENPQESPNPPKEEKP